MRGIHIILILAVLGIAGGIGYLQYTKSTGGNVVAAPAAPAGPPAGAVFIPAEVQPVDVINAGQMFVGQWVPEPGWLCGIESVTKESGAKALRVAITQASAMQGTRWLVVVVPEDTALARGDFFHVTGRIDAVGEFNDGGIAMAKRVVLRDTKIVPLK